jgi:hypothetical protein
VELPLARLLLVLSHHPDYMDISLGELKRLTKWVVIQQGINADQLAKLTSDFDFRHIEFFLDSVANRDNVSLLYHIASKIKTVRDTYPTMIPMRTRSKRKRRSQRYVTCVRWQSGRRRLDVV